MRGINCLALSLIVWVPATQAGVFVGTKPATPENWPAPGLYRYDVEGSTSRLDAPGAPKLHMKRDGASGVTTNWMDGQKPMAGKPDTPITQCIAKPSPEAFLKLKGDCRPSTEKPGKAYDEYAFSCQDGTSGRVVARRTGPSTWEISAELQTSETSGSGGADMRRNVEAAMANASPEERRRVLSQLPSDAEINAMEVKQREEMRRSAARVEAEMAQQDLSGIPPEQLAQMRRNLNAMHSGSITTGGKTVTKTVWRYTKISDTCTGTP